MNALDILVNDLKASEGYRRNVYDDAVAENSPNRYPPKSACYRSGGQYKIRSTGGTATIGYGETDANLLDKWWAVGIPLFDATELLRVRAKGFLDRAMSYVKVPLNPHQQAAIGSLAYNIGVGGFSTSTVLRYINEGKHDKASITYAFRLWSNPDGSLRGRRDAEIKRFLTPWNESESEFVAMQSLVSVHSGYVLDVIGGAKDDRAPIQQYRANGTKAQSVIFEDAGDGLVRVKFEHSGKYLDADPNRLEVVQFGRADVDGQLWYLDALPNVHPGGIVQLRSKADNRVLDVAGFSNVEGARIIMWKAGNGANQQWVKVNFR